jgi:uncharacterized membrane protein YkvA (DUF1232 family)
MRDLAGREEIMQNKNDETQSAPDDYSDEGFWQKVLNVVRQAGREVIEKSLILYYAAQDPSVPQWAKTVIYGALAYFIWPADSIPDAIPVAGYTDDLGALALALTMVALYITPEVKEKAKAKVKDLFPGT